MSRWQAIIFDLDDTIYPEYEYVMSGFAAVAAWAEDHMRIRKEDGFTELQQLYRQGVRGNTFNQWLASHRIEDASLVRELVQIYRDHTPQIVPFAGMVDLLAVLHLSKHLGIITDGVRSVQQRKVEALGIAAWLDTIVYSDEWGRESWKPSTLPYRVAMEKLHVDGTQAVYIADNPIKDFKGANETGMATIWARYSLGDYTKSPPPSPVHAAAIEVDSIDALRTLLI